MFSSSLSSKYSDSLDSYSTSEFFSSDDDDISLSSGFGKYTAVLLKDCTVPYRVIVVL